MSLHVDKLYNDPRYLEAKKLIFAALHDAQKDITEVKEPTPELCDSYQALLDSLASLRGFPLYYPYLGSGIGNGPFVELKDGSIKFDLISGIGVHYFGHSHPDLLLAAIDGAVSDTIMQGNLQQNFDALELSLLLRSLSGFDHCFLSTSGAMACENALKIAFQKKQPKTRILAFEKCFAGRTLALSQVTDKPQFRQGLPSTVAVDYVPFCNPESTLKTLKSHIARYPHQHAVMCMELVQGEGGFWVGNEPIFKEIIEILRAHDIAVWIDEVQTFARTEQLFAFQHFHLDGLSDIVTIGKAAQVCATLYTKEICPKPGLLSQTFTASSSAIHASKQIIDHAMSGGFFGSSGKIARQHEAFTNGLKNLGIQGPYGIGSMIACTLFDGDESKTKLFLQKLFQNGVIAFLAGSNPSRVRFLLPVGTFELSHVDPVMKIIEKTVRECS
jgi:acetylornithine/succinyldiaminopimelate/putrescine aminotransferase